MKKLFCLLLALCLFLSVGCTNAQGGDDTTENPGETSGEPEAYTPQWHLSETIEEDLLLSGTSTNVGVKVPLVCEETVNGILFRFDFFEEFYPHGSLMQIRMSVTNNTSEDIIYSANKECLLGMLYKETDDSVESDETDQAPRFLQVHEPNGEHFSYYTDDTKPRDFHAGETIVFERAVRVTPDYFVEGGSYLCAFAMMAIDECIYEVEIPISVVNRNEQQAEQ